MADRAAAPGFDQIAVAEPPGRCPCNSREHAKLGCLAEVIVTFGRLGVRWARDALWQDCWGRSYPMCSQCWQTTREIAEERRPGLVVIEAAAPPARSPAPVSGPRGRG